jgi:cell division protein ZapA
VPQVAVRLNGREYAVTCGEGEERHVLSLAAYVDEKVAALAKAIGQVGEARLLALASILVADELKEARDRIARLEGERKESERKAPAGEFDLEGLARRIEDIAARLESA